MSGNGSLPLEKREVGTELDVRDILGRDSTVTPRCRNLTPDPDSGRNGKVDTEECQKLRIRVKGIDILDRV